ncbi:barstar family protein [Kitasatospora sp. NPDC085879]|uniref:barstar family protein n=1 Tax=Kitasatospora sp. NPDC085879 TaxID=3154769 RepID=UPI00342D666E
MEESELVIDVRGHRIDSLRDFVDVILTVEPRAFPEWQGANLNALWDTFGSRGISALIDSHDVAVIRADRAGLLADDNPAGAGLRSVFDELNAAERARLELFD